MKIRVRTREGTKEHEIPDICNVYKIGNSNNHIIVADYNRQNLDIFDKKTFCVFSYNYKYLLAFFNADAIFGIAVYLRIPDIGVAYMKCYKRNDELFDQASKHFHKDIDINNMTDAEEKYMQEHAKIVMYYQKICCITENGARVIRVFPSDGSTITSVKAQRRSPTMAFCWQPDVLGVSDDNDTIYSEFCTKEEYDKQLYIALKNMGVKDFTI